MYLARGEKTSASTGKWVFRKRRRDCASTTGSFTAFGGTRRSSHGDSSATASSGSGTEQHLSDDLLHPGRSRLRVRRNHDVVVPEREIVPDRRVEVVRMEFSSLFSASSRLWS
jgi:hypothetical protein